jgi:ATP-dependent DNA helicase RecG
LRSHFEVVFYQDPYTEECLRELGLNRRQVKAVLYVKETGEITLSAFKVLAHGVSDNIFYRDLQELVALGALSLARAGARAGAVGVARTMFLT